jgi:hypothetical protein
MVLKKLQEQKLIPFCRFVSFEMKENLLLLFENLVLAYFSFVLKIRQDFLSIPMCLESVHSPNEVRRWHGPLQIRVPRSLRLVDLRQVLGVEVLDLKNGLLRRLQLDSDLLAWCFL